MSTSTLEMRSITKVFPGVKALENVNLKAEKGSVHAICGENGAGKSTLIKVLCGVYASGSYDGEIYVDGELCRFRDTADAEERGIVCIHQELELIPELSVGENIFLGNYPKTHGVIQWDQMFHDTREALKKVGLDSCEGKDLVKPEEKVSNLGIGKQQLVEIAKALTKEARIIIFDEPTAALSETEVDILLNIILGLKAKGILCIYISHRLDEVIKIADEITVIRDGKHIITEQTKNLTKNDIIANMVGRELTNLFPREKHQKGEEVLRIESFSVWDTKVMSKQVIFDMNFVAHKGEILGISGLMGAGRTELFSAIYGVYGSKRIGSITIEGKPVEIQSAVDALKHGIFLVTEDRKQFGLVLGMGVKENTTMASLAQISNFGVINDDAEISMTSSWIERLKTKTPNVSVKVNNLSGGNQQKVVLQKALMTKPKVLILDEPTRGIDVGAKYEIYKIMNQLVDEGVVIIMISSEMEEILGMSDRILVMSRGKLTAEFLHGEATQEKIMHASIGGGKC